jgi:hypothetical protein
VGTEGTEQRLHVFHPPVVDTLHPLGDRLVATSPVADGQLDFEQFRIRIDDLEQPPQLGSGVTALAVGVRDHLVDHHPPPLFEHLLERRHRSSKRQQKPPLATPSAFVNVWTRTGSRHPRRVHVGAHRSTSRGALAMDARFRPVPLSTRAN